MLTLAWLFVNDLKLKNIKVEERIKIEEKKNQDQDWEIYICQH